jgi:hypothetical protein
VEPNYFAGVSEVNGTPGYVFCTGSYETVRPFLTLDRQSYVNEDLRRHLKRLHRARVLFSLRHSIIPSMKHGRRNALLLYDFEYSRHALAQMSGVEQASLHANFGPK